MGYKRAGYHVLGCVEIDPAINAIYRRNLRPENNYLMDLRDFNRLPDADIPPELFALDVLDGSPPCSTFSLAGKREKAWGVEKRFKEGQAKQTLDDLFFVFLETVERLRPRAVVAENVTGLVKGNAKGYVNAILARFREIGYAVQLFVLNAAFMEVPQRRERVFFVANRCGFPPLRLDFRYPPVTFGEVKTPQGEPVPLSEDPNALCRLLAKARDGDTKLSDVCERERGRNVRFNWCLVRDGDVSPTLTASIPHIRMPERTTFSAGDFRACATFPEDYDFGDRAAKTAQYLCGMSVPPSMAAHVADEIRTQWLTP